MKRNIAKLRAAWHSSAANYDNTAHLVTCGADIPWISGGNEGEWLYIDLGAVSESLVTVLDLGRPADIHAY